MATDAKSQTQTPFPPVPIDRIVPTPVPLRSDERALYWFKAISFSLIVLLTSIAILCLQLIPGLLIYTFHSHTAFRSYIRLTEQIFGCLVVALLTVYTPRSAFVLTGDFERMRPMTKSVVMANHQIYPDWFYLWILARITGNHGDVKILLMQYLKNIPLLGLGMQMFEFIFLAQKWTIDESRITSILKLSKDPKHPLWLLIFPEGTLNTPGNVEKSRKYAEKMNIPVHPHHVILPKSTGLHHCLTTLQPEVKTLFDITIGYSGLTPTDIPFYTYEVDTVLFRGIYPQRVHIHMECLDAPNLPGIHAATPTTPITDTEKTEFNLWLRDRFMIKDRRLDTFYETGSLVMKQNEKEKNVEEKVVEICAQMQDYVVVVVAWYMGLVVAFPYYWVLIRIVLRIAVRVLSFGYL